MNAPRGDIAEEIVLAALEPEWKLCSEDWAGWDLINDIGQRIQVRQSSALQTWESMHPKTRSFNIAPAQGYWKNGRVWIDHPARHAEIYILAWHPVLDAVETDHLDPQQWRFFVIPAIELPMQKSIRQTVVASRWSAVAFAMLRDTVNSVSASIQ